MDGYTDSALPPFTISNENKARMVTIAVEENVPVDHGLGIVLDYYLQLTAKGHNLDDLHSVLNSVRSCGNATSRSGPSKSR
jgi:hypothetical protein